MPASIFSPDWVSPTSEPSKYQANVPAVVAPSWVGVKRTTSKGVTVPRPGMFWLALKTR